MILKKSVFIDPLRIKWTQKPQKTSKESFSLIEPAKRIT